MRNLEPWEIFTPDVFDGNRYCVYQHYADGILFYIGSGQIARAFEFEPTRRCPAWQKFAAGKKVSVVLVMRSNDRNAMRRLEYKNIQHLRPIGNETLEPEHPFDYRVVNRGRPDAPHLVATDNDRLTVVRCEPGGYRFPTVRDASKALNVSPGSIYNSISGRHPDVRGYRFFREERLLPRA